MAVVIFILFLQGQTFLLILTLSFFVAPFAPTEEDVFDAAFWYRVDRAYDFYQDLDQITIPDRELMTYDLVILEHLIEQQNVHKSENLMDMDFIYKMKLKRLKERCDIVFSLCQFYYFWISIKERVSRPKDLKSHYSATYKDHLRADFNFSWHERQKRNRWKYSCKLKPIGSVFVPFMPRASVKKLLTTKTLHSAIVIGYRYLFRHWKYYVVEDPYKEVYEVDYRYFDSTWSYEKGCQRILKRLRRRYLRRKS